MLRTNIKKYRYTCPISQLNFTFFYGFSSFGLKSYKSTFQVSFFTTYYPVLIEVRDEETLTVHWDTPDLKSVPRVIYTRIPRNTLFLILNPELHVTRLLKVREPTTEWRYPHRKTRSLCFCMEFWVDPRIVLGRSQKVHWALFLQSIFN